MKIKNLLDDEMVSGKGKFRPKNGTEKPAPIKHHNEEKFKLPVQIIQPWSNMIVKIRIPDNIFKNLLDMYDETMKDWKSFGHQLVGQVEEEPEVSEEMRNKYPLWKEFCVDSVIEYVRTATLQTMVAEPDKIREFMSEQVLARLTTMWFVKQKPGEYNPTHIHTNCKVSSVCYLKTPKQQVVDRKQHFKTDGKITFSNNTGTDGSFSNSIASFEPKVGEMYIFGALQHHSVWPYRSADPNDERVSLSFNADFRTTSQIKEEQQKQEMMYQDMKKYKEEQQQSEVKNDKSSDASNINKSG